MTFEKNIIFITNLLITVKLGLHSRNGPTKVNCVSLLDSSIFIMTSKYFLYLLISINHNNVY